MESKDKGYTIKPKPKDQSQDTPHSDNNPSGKKTDIKDNNKPNGTKETVTKLEQDIRHEQWIMIGLTAILALVGIVQACIYYGQFTTQRLDERAWVSIAVDPSIPAQNDVQIFWPLHINNVGKTFASHIEGDFFATVLKKGESPQFDYSIGHPHRKIYVGGIFPNEALPQTSIRVEKYGPHTPEPVLMTQELRQAIASNEQAIVVYGIIQYDDIFGVHHWTQFCNGTGDALQLDAIKKCINYNNADSNH
jgi:hypothetical protein